jgi:hypothetical protein
MIKRLACIFVILIGLASCEYITEMNKTGDIVSKDIAWEGAEEIEIWAPIRLILVNSDSSYMHLSGMDFIIEGYRLYNQDGRLFIKHNKTEILQESKIANLYVYSPSFKRIDTNSPCKITTNGDTLDITSLSIVVNGKGLYTTGDFILKGDEFHLSVYGGVNKTHHNIAGQVNNAYYHLEGGCDIIADKLQSKSCEVTQKAYGDIYLCAEEKLLVRVYSTGNVYFKGDPEIDFEQVKNNMMKASGKLIKLN